MCTFRRKSFAARRVPSFLKRKVRVRINPDLPVNAALLSESALSHSILVRLRFKGLHLGPIPEHPPQVTCFGSRSEVMVAEGGDRVVGDTAGDERVGLVVLDFLLEV